MASVVLNLSIQETSYSIENNTSNINWALSVTAVSAYNGYDNQCPYEIRYNNASGSVIASGYKGFSNNTTTALASGTITDYPHNSDGSATITLYAHYTTGVSPSSASTTNAIQLTTIPRQASMTSATDFNDEQNPSFTFTKAGTGTLDVWLEPNPDEDHLCVRNSIPNTGSYTWDLTDNERNQLRAKCTTSNSCTCRIGLYTNINGTYYASFQDKTMYIVNANPIFNPTFTESYLGDQGTILPSGTTSYNLTGSFESIIKNYSTLTVNITTENKATAQKEATMSYYKVNDIQANYSDTSNVVLDIPNYASSTVTILAVDSRGNSTSYTKELTLIDYQDLVKNSASVSRSDSGVGKFVTLSFSGTFWNGNFGTIDNSLTVTYKYKKTTDTDYTTGTTTITPTISDNKFSFSGLIAGDTEDNGFDIENSYDIMVEVSDKVNKITYNLLIGTGTPAIAVYKNKVALGDKYDTSIGGIQLWGDIYINGDKMFPIGSIYLSVTDTNPSTWFGGTWEQIAKGRTLVGVDIDDTDFNEVKKTGGSKYLQKHSHSATGCNVGGTASSTCANGSDFYTTSGNISEIGISETGDGDSGNLQPYFTCYIWCRTA